MRVLTTYDEISIKATHRWKDENGKRKQKTKKFFQTLNPYNTNAEGKMKTEKEIYDELIIERDAWLKEQENGINV